MKKFLKFVTWFGISAGAMVVKGYVISMLWLWFVVGAFHVAPINIPQGVGISVLATVLSKQFNRAEAERIDAHSYAIKTAYAVPLMALLVGYITKQFL